MKKKILFLIHDLGGGGAEKVLVNLANRMNPEKFDITVEALFGGGINVGRLAGHIRYIAAFPKPFPGNSHVMKLLSPAMLHRILVREKYDTEIAYLEGPATRVIAGCRVPSTRLHAWVHCTPKNAESLSASFRSVREARECYAKFHGVHCVSGSVASLFRQFFPEPKNVDVLYNTIDTDSILAGMHDAVEQDVFRPGEIRICGVGKLTALKGFDRLASIHKALRDSGFPVHTYLLGSGEEQENLKHYAEENGISDSFTLLGYQQNPYKYMSRCDIFACASHSEGFSTAATEALILGLAVCTVEVSGMKEMLGESNEYGIVTANTEAALHNGLKGLVESPEQLAHYKRQAQLRGKSFHAEETARAVEAMLMEE